MTLEQPIPPAASPVTDGRPGAGVYDVAIIGGALSGAATAVLLLQKNPALRVLIVERSAAFERRVGESTIEISTYFLIRVNSDWRNTSTSTITSNRDCGSGSRTSRRKSSTTARELGGRFLTRVPAFMVDRAVLDEEVLRRACALGAEVRRPAQMVRTELAAGGQQHVTIRDADGHESVVRARWAVDASGVRALLARQEGWHRQNEDHPTAAVWSRWSGVKNLDGPEMRAKFPEWAGEDLRDAPHGDQPR